MIKQKERNRPATNPVQRRSATTRWATALCALLLTLLPSPSAQSEPSQQEEQRATLALYHDCVLKKVQPAQSAVAASHLQQACQRTFAPDKGEIFEKNGTQRLNRQEMQRVEREENRLLDECLLNHLPTVHNDQSANAMVQLCTEQFGPGTHAEPSKNRPNILLQLLGIPPQKPGTGSPEWTMENDAFVPLVPWPGGQSR